MSIFKPLTGLDFSILREPIGQCRFDPVSGEFVWDLEYTKAFRDRIVRILDEAKKAR